MSCPQVPIPSISDQATNAAHLMTAMGAQACQTDNKTFSAQATLSSLFVSLGIQITAGSTSTLGCEQLLAISNKYNQSVANINCILNKSSNVVSTIVNNVNSFKVSNIGNGSLKMVCPQGIKVTQGINAKIITSINLSDSEISQINNETKAVITEVAKTMQKNISDIGATASGGKQAIDSLTNIQNINNNSNIRETIKSITSSISNTNAITFENIGNGELLVAGSDCIVNQDMVVNILSKAIVDNAISNAFSSVSDSINKISTETVQQTEGTGFGDIVRSYWSNFFTSASINLIVGGIVLIIVLGALIKILPSIFSAAMESGKVKKLASKNML